MQSVTIDWLSFTFKEHVNAQRFKSLSPYLDPSIATTPRFGYRYATASADGILHLTVMASGMGGEHYIYPGSALAALYSQGYSPFFVLGNAVSCGAKVTRLDLAKDVTGENVQLEDIWQDIQAGNYTGASQAHSRIESDNGGYTIYIGSRVSEKFIRIYDKGVENGTHTDWKRCELELKGDTAKAIARHLADLGVRPGAVFDALSRRMFDCNSPAWKSFRGEDVPLSIPKVEKLSDREQWIAGQVTHAVLQHLRDRPDSQAAFNLYRLLDNKFRATL